MIMTETKKYKVLIPTAGIGSRLDNLTKYLNKSLVSVQNKPIIARIIDMFPKETEFVIALGYKGDLVKQFLSLAYPEKKFYFSTVEKYDGEGSGLGLTILSCEKYLQPTPTSPLHSSTIASWLKSTGANASSESQPLIPPLVLI